MIPRTALVLDDDATRHEWFDANLPGMGYEVMHAWTVEEFRRRVQSHPDVIFFDFDLNDHTHKSIANGREQTGAAAAISTIAEVVHVGREARVGRAERAWEPFCIIHSWNPPGATELAALLVAGQLPHARWMFDPYQPAVLQKLLAKAIHG
jgi:CheY-like chemotaxis protein